MQEFPHFQVLGQDLKIILISKKLITFNFITKRWFHTK
ncbi:hypothetical protein LEP1GSC186_3098 [Leptospira noguchii serovar Autumnalis str. ZUN142]|uniref:Uncharacterized protein n=1 Tax=Leptospira noguchii serovar Autumnalis str. ZUN142 TaxID=1085540 RepID=M6UA93_9LEPT|nr:hypothetical protein LEP1GSC186_3098 [Leptospira noguchii serovar Autumnalis str. ZUN142]